MKIILAFVLVILNINYAHADYSNQDLMNMNLQSLRADFANDKAYSTGTGRIIHGKSNALTLARRAALSDARRGLLILKGELKESRPRTSHDVSGYVPPVKILDEYESGDIYVVRVEAVLSELMHDNKREEIFTEEADQDYEEQEENYDVSTHDYASFDVM